MGPGVLHTHFEEIKCHLINLPQDRARLSLAIDRASEVGLQPEVFIAQTGQDRSAGVYVDPSLSQGQVGCFLSHMTLLRRIAAEPTKSLHIVLEDDVVFFDRFARLLDRVVAEFASDSGAEIVQLGWIPEIDATKLRRLASERLKASTVLRSLARSMNRRVPVEAPLLKRSTPGWGMHCYLLSPVGADRLANFLDGAILAPVDHYLRAFSLIGPASIIVRTRFPLAGQDWGFSSTVSPGGGLPGGFVQIDDRGRKVNLV